MEKLSSNRLIAKNTIMLYVRMMLSMIISLYTSRVILQTLGVSDFGIYGVVAGIVSLFGFFSASMAGATSRFLSFELGIGDKQRLRDTFSSTLIIHIGIAILVVILCETIGIWFLENKLVIPADRMNAARFVFQLSIFTMIFQVIQVPFNATIISHERMDIYAYVEIANSILRLLIIYLLLVGNLDKLILYSILTCIVSIIIAGFYTFYSLCKFKECTFRLRWRKHLLKPMLSYVGWEFFGNMSLVSITQGVNMLLNMWFGTLINAAYDIANRVKQVIMGLSTNVTTAIRPQIVKTYSAKEIDRMFSLMMNGSRITFIFMLFFCIPMMIEAHYILNLWLGIVPKYSETLLQLSLMWNLIVSMSINMNDVVHAVGDVKFQNIVPGVLYFSILPITYIAFKLDSPYWVPFALNVLTVTSAPFYSGYTIKKNIKEFSWKKHVFPDQVRCYITMILAILGTYCVTLFMCEGFMRLVTSVLTNTLLVGFMGFFVILPKNIRLKIVSALKNKSQKDMLKKIIKKFIPKSAIKWWHKKNSTIYPIVMNPNEVFEIVYKVKDDSWENTYYPACYGHCKEQHLEVYIPAEYIYKTKKGIISYESDVVITKKGAYWEKYNTEEFVPWALPADKNVTWYDRKNISIRRYKKQEYISGRTLSLVGVWSYHWAHCMFEFMPKLFSAGEAGLLNNSISILIVENEDTTIMEIIYNYLKNFPNAKIIFVKPNIDYICEELYFMPSPGSSFCEPQFRLDYPYYISRHVLDKTKKYIIDPLIEKVKNNETKNDKLFLPRSGLHRTLTNYNEVHEYFRGLGFKDVEGSSLTLEQKADMFYHAKEIVGLYGSALLNLMFCNKANCMVLINYKMSTDVGIYLQIRDYCNHVINVTGQDEKPIFHTNYYIPLEKIKKVYNECIKF